MEEKKYKDAAEESLSRRHETTDANAKSVTVTGIGFMGIMVAGLLLSWAVYHFSLQRTSNPGTPAVTFAQPDAQNPPPAPWLQASPRDTLLMVRRIEDSLLSSYGWIRKEDGIVRVPIERAIDVVVEQGLPHREPAPEAKR